ncbi:MAG TPA: phosphatase PAP2 family protein [Gemmatimonadaceae bacterium]|nr:phosphatase PAP2 family protein [Gemmatimonadaceae bacterium]
MGVDQREHAERFPTGAGGLRHHYRWRRVAAWLAIGYVCAFVVGATFGWSLQRFGSWHDGLAWERSLMESFRVDLPRWLDAVVYVTPWLATNLTLLPAVILISAWLAFIRRPRRRDLALHLLVVELGAYTLNPALKWVFDRPRPDLWEKRGQFAWSSYPSGHAIAGVAVLFTIAVLLHRERGWRWPYAVVAAMLAVSLFSRLYLGVHWPTDVIAGVLIGAVWLAATINAFSRRCEHPPSGSGVEIDHRDTEDTEEVHTGERPSLGTR